MIVPKELGQRWVVHTYSLINEPNFLDDFKPNFTQKCAHDWEVFNQVRMLT